MIKGVICMNYHTYKVQSLPQEIPTGMNVIVKRTGTIYTVARKGKFGDRIVYDLKNPINGYHIYSDIEYIQQFFWLLIDEAFDFRIRKEGL